MKSSGFTDSNLHLKWKKKLYNKRDFKSKNFMSEFLSPQLSKQEKGKKSLFFYMYSNVFRFFFYSHLYKKEGQGVLAALICLSASLFLLCKTFNFWFDKQLYIILVFNGKIYIRSKNICIAHKNLSNKYEEKH